MQKRFFSIFLMLVFSISAFAQIEDPAKWDNPVLSKKNPAIGDEVELIFYATTDPGWYLYSSDFAPDLGPIPTTFDFKGSTGIELIGGIKPINPKSTYDDIFEMTYTYFEPKGEFRQKIRITAENVSIKALVDFQTCQHDGKCINLNKTLKLSFTAAKGSSQVVKNLPIDNKNTTPETNIATAINVATSKDTIAEPKTTTIDNRFESVNGDVAKGKDGKNYILYENEWLEVPQDNNVVFYQKFVQFKPKADEKYSIDEVEARRLLELIQTQKDYSDVLELFSGADNFKDIKGNSAIREAVVTIADNFSIKNPLWAESLWGIIFMSFSFGFAALLTPCVFPLIPMTVTFFMKSGKGKGIRDAIIYGISIVAIYTIIGVGVSFLFGADAANELATSAVSNIIFFIVFIVFAASFLGMFEITLPSWVVNKIDAQADKGGFLGPFFMAFTLVVVSFSCTGPIVGSVLVEAADGQFVKPIVAMLSFGTAIALPFTLFAIFPEWLGNLPKSGGWLNSVKVVLGFVEIALGLKFLSVADQVYGWGLLDREIYLSIWIAIFGLIALYLLGRFKLPHDGPVDSIGVPRLMLAMVSLSFVIYMIPGLWGAPLKELTGYLPPMSTQEDYHVTESIVRDIVLEVMEDRSDEVNAETANRLCVNTPKYSDKLHLPHGLKGYFEINEALQCAKELNKPLFIDFTGHGCVNCRKMEEQVWKDPKVLSRLRKDYIMVALYCDDKKINLTESEWIKSKRDTTEMLTTVGKINSEYQAIEFESNSQPQYVLMGPDGKNLLGDETRSFDVNIDDFVDFLDKGKDAFEKKFNNKK